MFNPIDFIYNHWQAGTIGLGILIVAMLTAVIACIIQEYKKTTKDQHE